MLDISWEPSAKEVIHMKCQPYFLWKKKKKKKKQNKTKKNVIGSGSEYYFNT